MTDFYTVVVLILWTAEFSASAPVLCTNPPPIRLEIFYTTGPAGKEFG